VAERITDHEAAGDVAAIAAPSADTPVPILDIARIRGLEIRIMQSGGSGNHKVIEAARRHL
jgi:hypothetical protein